MSSSSRNNDDEEGGYGMEKANDENVTTITMEGTQLQDVHDENEREKMLKDYALLRSLEGSRMIRKEALEKNGSIILHSIKSTDGWIRTLFVAKERAFDTFFIPWAIVTIHATIWTIFIYIFKFYDGSIIDGVEAVTPMFNLVLTTALAFLLVFRLNRVAIRWWDTRSMWGAIVADARILASCILEHTNHAPEQRDDAIGWLACFVVCVKLQLRGDHKLNYDEVAGFITPDRLADLDKTNHKCLNLAANIRHSLKKAFLVTSDSPIATSVTYNSERSQMEKYINDLILLMGGLERVKATPLPIVYVTHLRTFLMVYLLSIPYLYGHVWGLGTIPAVSVTAYILLGIDGAASECELPFLLRPNHLPMDQYCMNALNNIEDLYIESAMRRRENDTSC